MNEKIFIRTETSISSSWADSLETLNTFYTGDLREKTDRPDVSKIADYEQQANTYVRIDNRMTLFRNRNTNSNNFLALGIPTSLENQKVAYKEIDFESILNALKSKKYDSVHFGFYFDKKETVNEAVVVENSIILARNKETKKFENVLTGEELCQDDNLELALWFTTYTIGDTGIFYVVTNTNLLVIHEDLTGEKNGIDYVVINSHDGNFKSSVFAPSFSSEVVMVGDNVLFANSDKFTIDVLGNSFIHGFSGEKIPKEQLPNIELSIESSVPFDIDNNLITINMENKNVAYLKYRWVTGTCLDYAFIGKESLIYNYIIVKN